IGTDIGAARDARPGNVAAPHSKCDVARLSNRDGIQLRAVVVDRLAVRDGRRALAAGLFGHPGTPSTPEGDRTSRRVNGPALLGSARHGPRLPPGEGHAAQAAARLLQALLRGHGIVWSDECRAVRPGFLRSRSCLVRHGHAARAAGCDPSDDRGHRGMRGVRRRTLVSVQRKCIAAACRSLGMSHRNRTHTAYVSASRHDPMILPADLSVPVDDGAAFHLRGSRVPDIALPATDRRLVSLASFGESRIVVYTYPGTGRPGEGPLGGEWGSIPGRRG